FEITTRYSGLDIIMRYPRPGYDLWASFGAGLNTNEFVVHRSSGGSQSQTIRAFGVLIQAGAKQYLTKNITAGVEFRYLYNKWSKNIMGMQTSANLRSWSVLHAIGFSF
ncbi:MAG: hypothetical protein FWG35_07945, partial [Spirochaetaceae bacterium]|nr:hypothetical protein [Spirochaetaceae bacterium]